jgi:hypothetical protein
MDLFRHKKKFIHILFYFFNFIYSSTRHFVPTPFRLQNAILISGGEGGIPLAPTRAWALRALAPFESLTHQYIFFKYQKVFSKAITERVGFEPTVQFYPDNTLAPCRFRPLSHLSFLKHLIPLFFHNSGGISTQRLTPLGIEPLKKLF